MDFSDRTVAAIITGAAGVALALALRYGVALLSTRYLARLAHRRTPDELARLRTRLALLARALSAFVLLIVAWAVLEIFPTTQELARTFLASGAVIAVLFGVALSTPLGNIGAGFVLGVTQPVRLGDRVTVGDVTGWADEITLIHTVLLTDDDRKVYVPNSQLMSSVVVNRSIQDPRRTVTARVPVSLAQPVDRAREVVAGAVAASPQAAGLDVKVLVSELERESAWLTVTVHAPPNAVVDVLGSEVRERAVEALRAAGLLPR